MKWKINWNRMVINSSQSMSDPPQFCQKPNTYSSFVLLIHYLMWKWGSGEVHINHKIRNLNRRHSNFSVFLLVTSQRWPIKTLENWQKVGSHTSNFESGIPELKKKVCTHVTIRSSRSYKAYKKSENYILCTRSGCPLL